MLEVKIRISDSLLPHAKIVEVNRDHETDYEKSMLSELTKSLEKISADLQIKRAEDAKTREN